MTDQASREAFEEYFSRIIWVDKIHKNCAWTGWQAALTHANTEMEKMRRDLDRYKDALEDVREKAVKGYEKPELGGRYTSIVFRIDEALYTDPSEALPPTPKAEG